MESIKKCLLSIDEKGELIIIELDDEEEGIFYV
jgi:hypothetical protein